MGKVINNTNILIVGASQGIGRGFVKKMLRNPEITRIYAACRCVESARELINLGEEYPDRLVFLNMDITDETSISTAIRQVKEQVDKLHLVINCVGILHEGDLKPEKGLQQINPEHLLHYFQVNSVGGVLLAKHLLPLLRHDERSILANISAKIGSIGDNRLGGWYGYRASKAALNMFMRTVAIEYGRKSPNTIVVNLHPGTTDTKLSKPFQRNVPPKKLFSVERTVTQLLDVINQLELKDSGKFYSWDGSILPW